MATHFFTRVHVLAIILAVGLNASTFADPAQVADPYQKDYPWQKGPGEEDQEQQDQGGYQAPPPTGAMEGPARELGLSIGEIEIPALRLRLPRVRFPSLSMFITPPRMHTEPGIAPMTQDVQNQISVPTNSPPPAQDQTAPNGKKSPVQTGAIHRNAAGDVELARMRTEMEQFENRLDGKLAVLATSIEKLVEQKNREIDQQQPQGLSRKLAPLPIVDDSEQSAVRQSSYFTSRPITPTPSVHHELQRLRPTALELTPPVDATSARRQHRLPTPGEPSPLYR